MTQLALVNDQTLICENVSSDPRPAQEIVIPGFIVLDLENTVCVHWRWNSETQQFNQVESLGTGGMGYTYADGRLVQPMPTPPAQPQE
jgi:hypothetical protein